MTDAILAVLNEPIIRYYALHSVQWTMFLHDI
jgi:hypothetical protein